MAVRVKLKEVSEFVFAAVYLTVELANIPLVAGYDANAHQTARRRTDINTMGDGQPEYLVTSDINIFDVGDTPTFRNAISVEVMDIIL